MPKITTITLDELKELGLDLKKIVKKRRRKRTRRAIKHNNKLQDVSFFGKARMGGGGSAINNYTPFPGPPSATTIVRERDNSDTFREVSSKISSLNNNIQLLTNKSEADANHIDDLRNDVVVIRNIASRFVNPNTITQPKNPLINNTSQGFTNTQRQSTEVYHNTRDSVGNVGSNNVDSNIMLSQQQPDAYDPIPSSYEPDPNIDDTEDIQDSQIFSPPRNPKENPKPPRKPKENPKHPRKSVLAKTHNTRATYKKHSSQSYSQNIEDMFDVGDNNPRRVTPPDMFPDEYK